MIVLNLEQNLMCIRNKNSVRLGEKYFLYEPRKLLSDFRGSYHFG